MYPKNDFIISNKGEKNLPKGVTSDEFLNAVKQGVKEAILTMTESGDGYSGPIIRELFLDAIKQGVKDSFPADNDICLMVKEGVYDAMISSKLK